MGKLLRGVAERAYNKTSEILYDDAWFSNLSLEELQRVIAWRNAQFCLAYFCKLCREKLTKKTQKKFNRL